MAIWIEGQKNYLAKRYINQPKAIEARTITRKRVKKYFRRDLKSGLRMRDKTTDTRKA